MKQSPLDPLSVYDWYLGDLHLIQLIILPPITPSDLIKEQTRITELYVNAFYLAKLPSNH